MYHKNLFLHSRTEIIWRRPENTYPKQSSDQEHSIYHLYKKINKLFMNFSEKLDVGQVPTCKMSPRRLFINLIRVFTLSNIHLRKKEG